MGEWPIKRAGARFLVFATIIVLTAWLAIPCRMGRAEDTVESANYVFRNGTIRTLTDTLPTAACLAVRGERIVFVGPEDGVIRFIDDATQTIDLQGATVLPGFTDAHVHVTSGGLALLECDLSATENPGEVLAALARFAERHPDRRWVRGVHLSLPAFPGNDNRKRLDQIIPDRPVFVRSADGHNAWANSRALELAGVTASTPDPLNGRIDRDPTTGEPTGTLRESAMSLIERVLPAYTSQERAEAVRKGLRLANSLGVTNLIEANASDADIEAYRQVLASGELTAHVSISLACDISRGSESVQDVLRRNAAQVRIEPSSDDLRFGQVKLFMDGVVEGKTAAMLEPYEGESHRGIANTDPATANDVIAALDAAELQIHLHAIGTRGIRMSLDAIEHARQVNGIRDARHHIAHLHVIHPDDIGRFHDLGVVANFQALWASLDDRYVTELNFPFLGARRAEWQYPIGSVARTRARLAFGSDWPVSTMNPFHATQVAVTRRGPVRETREPWTPQHLIELGPVIEGYTKGGAFLTFREADCGTLEVGKLADLVVLDRDLFQIPATELLETQVKLTMFRGRVVYRQ